MDPLAPPPSLEPASPILTSLAESANEILETSVNQATHQAFNLGCLIGLLPAIIFSAITFWVTGFSLIGAAMGVVLGITGAIAFANLAAMITRRNTLERTYRDQVAPHVTRSLSESGHSQEEFERAVQQALAPGAMLYPFVNPPQAETAEDVTQEEYPE